MRRSSNAVLQTQTSEPLIVVEDSNFEDFEEKTQDDPESRHSSEDESPTMNPYLLSPYARDIRKHSLPTPQCSGITASQVRRLSERGETVGPGPRQAEFLATLSTAPAPSPGGRRHSVVTISKVPSTLFGRNRRESVAAFPSPVGFPRVLPNRRESIACPPSEPRGSVHNLQLDVMDDIVQARKVRMKLFTTSNERVCEVQPLDDSSSVQRYTNTSSRRYSDFVGTTLAPIPSSTKRRASEMPPPNTCATTSASKLTSTGIVCSNTDLISILSSLSTSSMEINQCEAPKIESSKTSTDEKRSRLKSNRSNSFDISILHSTVEPKPLTESHSPSHWLAKRHQPSSTTTPNRDKSDVVATEPGKVIWDGRSGSLVDPQALGSAIEVFLRHTTPDPDPSTHSPSKASSSASSSTTPNKSTAGRTKVGWFSNKSNSDSTETCDTSICSTLKDLFVK